MSNAARKHHEPSVPMMLTGGRVLAGFRREVWEAAARSGVSINEFVLRACGQALALSGAEIPGVFQPGDIHPHSSN
jgi:hypothetical protein